MPSSSYNITQIGRVISPIVSTKEMPLQGVQAKIEVFEEYETALKGVDNFTHLLVIGFLHLSDRTVLQARPRKIDPLAPLRGVFSIRSPVRPNPLSINAVKLLGYQGRILTVDRLDLINDTPIIDIKPYVDWDCIFSARRLPSGYDRILKKFSYEERIRDFLRQAKNFHGSVCPGIAIGALACAAIFPKYIPISRLKSKKLIVIVESDRCLADAITAITGCTLGRRSLKFKDFGKMAAIFLDQQSNHAYRVALSSKMRKITSESPIDDLLTQPIEEMFSISPVKLHLSEFDLPGYPKAKTICSICGETVRDHREILQNEIPQCQYCSRVDKYYQQISKESDIKHS